MNEDRRWIGVAGCRRNLPSTFPFELSENSGNLVHSTAPMSMFPNAVDATSAVVEGDFAEWVNSNCTHLVYTFANILRFDRDDPRPYVNAVNLMKRIKVPIVPFGLGAQAPSTDLDALKLPREGVEFLKYLSDRSARIGVRGQFTADAIKQVANISNVEVTGGPSFFSRPESFARLLNSQDECAGRRGAYSATHVKDPREQSLFREAIIGDLHWIEPVAKVTAEFARALQRGDSVGIPWWIRPVVSAELHDDDVKDYFSRRFQLFRGLDEWLAFNRHNVGWTSGTRFHVNMASLLSGVPAMWIHHDTRTSELVEHLRLPAMSLDEAADLGLDGLRASTDYSEMIAVLPHLFGIWNGYLAAHGLPATRTPAIPGVAREPARSTLRALVDRFRLR